jgi:hypothetical protein
MRSLLALLFLLRRSYLTITAAVYVLSANQGAVWLEFRAEARVGVLFKLLREELDRLLLAQIEAPGDEDNLSAGAAGSTAVSAVLQLLEDEERKMLY